VADHSGEYFFRAVFPETIHMFFVRHRVLAVGLALLSLAAVARVQASVVYEPNNSPNKAAVLPARQFIVSDDLNGSAGRAATLLGEYDPQYKSLSLTSATALGVGNGFGSQLRGVPLRPNGSAYFRVTGAGDATFDGDHNQTGRYSIEYQIYNAQHALIETKPLEFENVFPHMIDNIWLDPPTGNEPSRTGGTVDVTINNIVGPGTGDSLDFFVFSGMQPFQPFTATISGTTFHPLIGLFNNANSLVTESTPLAALPTFTAKADSNGRALIGVTGSADGQFKGEHIEVGTYTLVVTPASVPEPASALLLGMGAVLACLFWRRRRR
jgi:PEP-CTERM motif-containing protein